MATLQIEKWERWFLYATVVVLVAFLHRHRRLDR